MARSGTIEEAFWRFHEANPHVYARLVRLARDLVAKGRKRLGIKMLFEVLRWHHLSTCHDDSPFLLDNNFHSYYSRLIMASEPDLDGIFELRKLNAAEPFGQAINPAAPVGHVVPTAPPGWLFDPEELFS